MHVDHVEKREIKSVVQSFHQSAFQQRIEYQTDVGLWQHVINKYKIFSFYVLPDTCKWWKNKTEWLIFSPSTRTTYSVPCVLFDEIQSQSQFRSGVSD